MADPQVELSILNVAEQNLTPKHSRVNGWHMYGPNGNSGVEHILTDLERRGLISIDRSDGGVWFPYITTAGKVYKRDIESCNGNKTV